MADNQSVLRLLESQKLPTLLTDLLSAKAKKLELVSKELNHLAAILQHYVGVWFLWYKKIDIIQKENENTFTLNHFYSEKSSKRAK